jgi:predicted amidophosphoribosyltransferase
MPCLACARFTGTPLCPGCDETLDTAPQRMAGGVLVTPALRHSGAARRLVHRLKYGGSRAAGRLLASAMTPLLPSGARTLVPLPRARLRRWAHGVDPALELADAVGAMTGLPVVACLRPAPWWPHRAGPAGRVRGAPRFTVLRPTPPGAVLIDDVVTTGTTMRAAGSVLGVSRGLTATSAR